MNEPPSVLSWEFHAVYFPRMLWSRLNLKKKEEKGVSFNSNMGLTVMLFVCLLALALGAGMAGGPYSPIGWILVALGTAGMLLILIFSFIAQQGTRPTYDDFLVWIFFFSVFLGLTAGLFLSSVNHYSRGAGLGVGALGLVAGYIAGIVAGRWAQILGWISGLLNGLAGLAIIGLIVLDILLLLR